MVRLRRCPPPSGLVRYGALWTQRWLAIRSGSQDGDWATQRAKEILSGELRRLTFGKCAFCEGLLGVTAYLEIEHYVAKTLDPAIAFQWENLFPICRLCNSAKSNTDHAGALLRPDVEDPESMLWLNPDNGELQPKPFLDVTDRSRIEQTIELCGLQRGPLCTKRINTMSSAIRWVERLAARNGQLDAHLREEWNHMKDPATEYKFVIRHVLEIKGQPALAAFDRLKFERG